jgi:hypothetical protein
MAEDCEFDSSQGTEIFLFISRVMTGSGAHLAFYPMDTRGFGPARELITYLHLVPRLRVYGGPTPLPILILTRYGVCFIIGFIE